MPRYKIFATDKAGKEHVFPSNNPYPGAVFYRQDADKYLADMRAGLGDDMWERKKREFERMKARGSFGVWRLAALVQDTAAAHAAAKSRSKDWGVAEIYLVRTRVEDVTHAKAR